METEQPEVPEQEQDGATAETLTGNLRILAEYLDEIGGLAGGVQIIEQAIERIEAQALILRTLFPEAVPGQFFVCGHGQLDAHGYPETIHICPAYGADIRQVEVYRKAER